MFENIRKYTNWLILILLGLFFVTFVIDDYGDETQKANGVCMECIAEIEDDEAEWEDDDLSEDMCLEGCTLEIAGIEHIILCPTNLSPAHLSAEQFRGLVRRYAPRPNLTYNQLFKNGIDPFRVYAIFYSENQIIKLWDLQMFLLQS